MKSRIQIIDDNVALTTLLAKALAKFGYEPVVENNPLLAVNTVRHYMPDLILLDIMMPERDGGRVLTDLRNDLSLRYIPVVLLTAIAREAQTLANTGGILSPVLAKPVQLQELLATIESSLNGILTRGGLPGRSNEAPDEALVGLPDFDQETPWIDQPRIPSHLTTMPSSTFAAHFPPREAVSATPATAPSFAFPHRPDEGSTPG